VSGAATSSCAHTLGGGPGGSGGTVFINGVISPASQDTGGGGGPGALPGTGGGGGGGGFFGGGGGGGGAIDDGCVVFAGGGGGGGGSDFVASSATGIQMFDNVGSPDPNGNGEVIITWSSAPAPAVTAVTPNSGPSTGGTVVTITGTGFAGATAVMFGANPATNLTISDTAITATAPAGAVGPVDITVTTPAGTSATSPADQFTYLVPTPAVTAISPASGPEAGGTVVTISGTDFLGASAVHFGSAAAAGFTVNGDTSITATAPAAAAVGAVDITVTTVVDTSAPVTADRYSYIYPFGGFQAPVSNPPAINMVHAGQAIPLQFSLGGNQGMSILATGYPTARQVSCATGAPINTTTETDTSGNSGLQYDATTNTYTYVWKTSKASKGTCQTFTLGLADGTVYTVNFQYAN